MENRRRRGQDFKGMRAPLRNNNTVRRIKAYFYHRAKETIPTDVLETDPSNQDKLQKGCFIGTSSRRAIRSLYICIKQVCLVESRRTTSDVIQELRQKLQLSPVILIACDSHRRSLSTISLSSMYNRAL